jgi:multidrug resistance efflux pump
VGEGEVLAVLSNPELEARVATLTRERMMAERQFLSARTRNDLAQVQRHQKEMERVEAALREARFKHDRLTLRAPLEGIVTTPQVEQRVGEHVAEGDLVAVVADRRTMRARVLVHDRELEDVKEGAPVKLSLRAYPFRTVAGTVGRIMPAAAADRPVADPQKVERYGQELTNFFAVVLEVPNPDGSLREGMTGTAKIMGRRYPSGYRIARNAWRWFWSKVY